ncbi:MAG: putative methyl-accepting chemotaxis protein, partial [Rhodospirillales bacterium]|nr:putative methyl-accepting chemotaxis protein [Rhodospirillales bacterium]
MFRWLIDLKIRTKMILGLGITMVLIAAMAAVGLSGFGTAQRNIGSIDGAFAVATATDQALLALRGALLAEQQMMLAQKSDEVGKAREAVAGHIAEGATAIQGARSRTDDAALAQSLDQAKDAWGQLGPALDKLADFRTKALDARNGPFLTSNTQILQALQQALNQAKLDSPVAVENLHDARDRFGEQRVSVMRYFATGDVTQIALAKRATSFIVEYMNSARTLAGDSPLGKLIDEATVKAKSYVDLVDQVVALNKATADQSATQVEPLRAKLVELLGGVTQGAAQVAGDQMGAVTKATSRGGSVMGWTAGAALVLLVAVGFGMIWFIVRPLIGLNDAMQSLAAGSHDIAIPSVGQKDEVGDMARTVEVFKTNLSETDRLRHEQEAAKALSEGERRAALASLADGFEESVKGVVTAVSAASVELQASAETLSETAARASAQSTEVAEATHGALEDVQTVASASAELAASIREIGSQVSRSAAIAGQAAGQAEATGGTVNALAESAQKIGEVVALISQIASQTNLLALNATIEAARAGDAGKGFAVVASEVKSLAAQTARATEEIAQQIAAIQAATGAAVGAIKGIGQTIGEINEIATAIAAAVEEQSAATEEISRNVTHAAEGTEQVARKIGAVTLAAGETGSAAGQVLNAADELSRQSDTLERKVEDFLMQIRAA